MVKTIITIIVAGVLIICGTLYEQNYVSNQFTEFSTAVTAVYDKTREKTAVEDDVLALQKFWLNKKSKLHVFISHTEIKEIDLWISETVTLVRDKQWEDAVSKLEVVRELSEQLPKVFAVSFENIM